MHSFWCNALHKHLHCGDIVLCSERIFIADGFAFYSSRPRTAGDPSAVPSFPQARIFTQIFQNRNEKRTEHSIEFNRKVFRKRQSCAPCKCLRLCRSRGVLPVCERERDRNLHWNRCPSPLESADLTRSLDYANRRLQVARLLGRLANEMELFNNKSAVYLTGLQVDLGNQVGLVGSLGERHWAKGYELGYSRHMPSLAEALATIDRIRPELAALRVVRIGIFGSVARGTSRSNSDVDCLVQLADKGSLFDLISVKQLLEEAFGCPVDVVTPRGLKADVRDAVLGEVRYAA